MVIPEVFGPVRIDGLARAPMLARWDVSALAARETLRSAGLEPATVLATWSGSYAQLDGGGLFDDDPRTWGPKGWTALEDSVRALCDARSGGGHLCLRPHARHVLSDPIGCRRLLEAEWAAEVELLYDPFSMLAESMLASGVKTVADHVRRMYEEIVRFPADRLAGVCALPKNPIAGVSESWVAELETAWIPPGVPRVLTG